MAGWIVVLYITDAEFLPEVIQGAHVNNGTIR